MKMGTTNKQTSRSFQVSSQTAVACADCGQSRLGTKKWNDDPWFETPVDAEPWDIIHEDKELKMAYLGRIRKCSPRVQFWAKRWWDHPLNRGTVDKENVFDMDPAIAEKFDWQLFVEKHDIIYRYIQRRTGKLPVALPHKVPITREIYTKSGEMLEVLDPYSTVYKEEQQDPNRLYHWEFSMTNFDQRTVYKFTYGNVEAAFRMTRRLWNSRKEFKKVKDNYYYVIESICYDVLRGIQDELTGYAVDSFREWHDMQKIPKGTWEEKPLKYVAPELIVAPDTPLPLPVVEPELQYATVQTQEEAIEEYVEEFAEQLAEMTVAQETVTSAYEQAEALEEVEAQFLPVTRKYVIPQKRMKTFPFRFFPKLTKLEMHHPIRHAQGCKNEMKYMMEPIFTPEELTRSYFDDLPEIFGRIGRPDLQMTCCAPIREYWFRKKRIYAMQSAQRKWIPQSSQSCEVDYRDRVGRILTDWNNKLVKHLDKMFVLCHWGRFQYLTRWDLDLYARQQRVMAGIRVDSLRIETSVMRRQVRSYQRPPPLSKIYPLEAKAVLAQVRLAIACNCVEQQLYAVEMVEEMVMRWRNSPFDAQYTICPEDCRNWVPQMFEEAWDEPGTMVADPHMQQTIENAKTPQVSSGAPIPAPTAASGVTEAAALPVPIKEGESKVNLTMVDQRPADTAAVPTVKTVKHKEATQEDMYNMLDVVKRPMFIDRIKWDTTDEQGKMMRTWVMPSVYFSAASTTTTVCQNLNASYVLAMFGSSSFNMVVRIQINSVKFQQGRLICFFKPWYMNDKIDDVFNNYPQYPHTFIDASVSNTTQMVVPFLNVRDAFPHYTDPNSEYNYFGTFHVCVWNGLRTGANSSSDTSVSVWMWLEDLDVNQLCNAKDPGKIRFADRVRIIPAETYKDLKESELLHDSVVTSTNVVTWAPQSALLGSVASEVGATLVENLLQRVARGGNSRPHSAAPPQPVIVQPIPNSSFGDGVDLATSLTLHSNTALPPEKGIYRQQNLKDLTSEWSRIAIAMWKVTDSENDSLIVLPVMPMANVVTPTVEKSMRLNADITYIWKPLPSGMSYECKKDSEGYPFSVLENKRVREGSMLDYLSRAFYFWRGSIKYKFEIVCTRMHSGRLLLRYEPYGTEDTAKKECQKVATPGIVWDVQDDSTTLEMEAPYMSTQPWLSCNYIGDRGVIDQNVTRCTSGLLELTVMNKLKVTTGIASEVQINIYMAAGDDFRFACPTPLDQIMYVGRERQVLENKLEATWGFQETISMLYSYMTCPLVEKWDGTTTLTSGNNKWRISSNSSDIEAEGPFVRFASGETQDYDQFLRNVQKCCKYAWSRQWRQTVITPEFDSLTQCYQWLRSFQVAWPSLWPEVIPKEYLVHEKLLWWLSIALLREKAWGIKKMPTVRLPNSFKVFMVKESSYYRKEGMKAQSSEKVSTPGAINPFKSFKPGQVKDSSLMGENFMDMYTLMKRYSIWKNTILGPQFYKDSKDQLNRKSITSLLTSLGTMTQHELDNYLWEMVIPVTPMLPPHIVGDDGGTFVRDGYKNIKRLGDPILPQEGVSGGLGISSSASYVWQNYFGQLFTFWRGSLRYRFTFPEPCDSNNRPWWCTIVYHPRSFTALENQFVTIQTMARLRDMSKMGTVMFMGNVAANIDVRVPYYSKYNRLYASDSIFDDTTTMGSLHIYVPIRLTGGFKCIPPEINIDDFDLLGLKMWIWQAVADDFEFMIKRPAPYQYIWSGAWYHKVTPDERGLSYDRIQGSSENVEEVNTTNQLGSLRKTIHNTEQVRYFRNVGKLNPIKAWNTSSKVSTAAYDIQKWLEEFTWARGHLDRKTADIVEIGTSCTKCWKPQSDDIPVEEMNPQILAEAEQQANDDIDGVYNAIRLIPGMISDFRKVVDAASENFSEMKNVVTMVKEVASTGKEDIKEVKTSVQNAAEAVGTAATYAFNATRLAIFFKGVLDIFNAEDWNERWLPIASCALALGLSTEVVTKAGEWLFTQVGTLLGPKKVHEGGQTAQAWEDTWNTSWPAFLEEHATIFQMIAAGAITILTFYMTSTNPITAKVSSFSHSMLQKLRNFAFVGMAFKTFDWMFKWVADVIKTAALTVADWVSGGMVTAHRMSSHYPEVLKWLQSVERFNLPAMRSQLCWDHNTRVELWKKLDEGEALLKKLTVKSGSLYNTLMKGIMTLTKINEEVSITRNLSPFREDPFHLCLTGEPGCGKSTVLSFILNFACDQIGYPRKNRFYGRSEEEEYWNGYDGHIVTLMDDLCQDKKGVAIKEMIKMKSNLAWAVNMADIKDKGKQFVSKIIGTTTNVPFPTPDDIVTPKALWRRRDALIKVVKTTPVGVTLRKDFTDLRFSFLEPCPPGDVDRVRVLQEGLTIQEVLVIITELITDWGKRQRELVFASLQGKEVSVVDYGEDRPTPPVASANDGFRTMLRRKIPMNEVYAKDCFDSMNRRQLGDLTDDDYRELAKYPSIHKCVQDKDNDAQAMSTFTTLNNGVGTLKTKMEDFEWLQSRNFIQERLNAGDNGIPSYYFRSKGEVIEELGKYHLRKDSDGVITDIEWHAQAGELEDLLTEDLVEHVETKAAKMRQEANATVEARARLMNTYEALIEHTFVRRPRKIVRVASDTEMKGFVATHFTHILPADQNKAVDEMKKVFTWATGAKSQMMEGKTKDQLDTVVSGYFAPKYDKYWVKDDDGNWKMKFSDDPSEEEFEIESGWELMIEAWNQDKINDMKNVIPEKPSESNWIKRVTSFYTKETARIKDWFDKHPNVTFVLKVATGLAAIFAGYKLISYVCPKIIDKIKAAIAALFGWGAAKIGEERLERVQNRSRELAARAKTKLYSYYDWVRSLMRGSNDANLQAWADDDEKVKQFAESLDRVAGVAKNVVTLSNGQLQPESKRVMNAYMLGQDRVRESLERKTTLAQEATAIPKVYTSQGSNDNVATDIRQNVLLSNMCRLMWTDHKRIRMITGTFIGGRVLMAPYHFWHGAQTGQMFCITLMNGIEHWDTYDASRCVRIQDQDICLFQCGLRVGQFKDITKHFIEGKDLTFRKVDATLNLMTDLRYLIVHPVKAELVSDVNYELEGGEKIENLVAWEYVCSTAAGDCGGILLADNSAVRCKILGFHVSGVEGENFGSSTLLLREEILAALAQIPPVTKVKPLEYAPQQLIIKAVDQMDIIPQGNFTLHGAVSPANSVRLPHKTEIQPSAIHDLVREHVTEPSVLTNRDPRLQVTGSPLRRAIEKYGVPTMPFPLGDLEYVTHHIRNEVYQWPVAMGKRKLTDYEAVFGNEMIDFCDRMNLNASPGYPYTLSRPTGEKGKAYLFDASADDGIACKEYRHQYKSREKLAQSGIRKTSVWTDCLKDERRPLAKIAAGKTRAFMLPPADFVQLCRKYFMAFAVTFYQNCVKSFSAVGIDPYSFQWTALARKLRRNSNLAFAGDFHSFDGIFDPDILWQIGRIIRDWYKLNPDDDFDIDDDTVREVLLEEMIHTVHICKNGIYEKHQGNPSGNPLTVIINTFAHCFYIRLAWLGIAREEAPEHLSLHEFSRNVRDIYYGDDGLYTVKYETSKWFNCKAVSEFLARYHIEYTDEAKSGELYGVRPMTECTFLKNGFRMLPETNFWLAPIAQDTIYELTNWVKKSDDPINQLRENLEDVFAFAFHHGPEFFERILLAVNSALRDRGLKEVAQSYEHQKEQFLAKCRR